MMQAYCTSLDKGYLDRGLVLIESLEKWCQPLKLWVLAWDAETTSVLEQLASPNVVVLSPTAIEFPELRALKDKRSFMEYVLTCKPMLIAAVMGRARPMAVNYVDSDCCYLGRPDTVLKEIGDAPIAITPHRFSPHIVYGVRRSGEFNAGWIHMKRHQTSIGCLGRWHDQCVRKCTMDGEKGTTGDQKYLAGWPKRWGAYSVEHKGINLAPWNQLNQYEYTLQDGQIFVDEDPLVMYHFHQALKPAYELDPFIQTHLYSLYEEALERATTRRRQCV